LKGIVDSISKYTQQSSMDVISVDDVMAAAKAFGVTGMEIYNNVLLTSQQTKGMKEQIEIQDKILAKDREITKAAESRNNATSEYTSTLTNLIDRMSEAGKVAPDSIVDEKASPTSVTNQVSSDIDKMIKEFVAKAPAEFVSGIEGKLGTIDLSKALGDKNKAASALYDALNNAIILAGKKRDEYIALSESSTEAVDKTFYTKLANDEKSLIIMLTNGMSKVVESYGESVSQINFETQNKAISKQLAQLEQKNKLEQQYIFNGDSTVNTLMAQYNAELELKVLLDEKKITQADYNRLLADSNKYYSNDTEKAKALYDLSKQMGDLSAAINPFGDDERISEYLKYLKSTKESNIALAASFGLIKDGKIDLRGADEETLKAYNEARLKLEVDAERDYTNALRKIQNGLLSSLKDLSVSLDDENRKLMQGLAVPYNESSVQSASRNLGASRASNAVLVQKEMEKLLSPSEVKAIKDSGGAISAEMMLSAEEIKRVSVYKTHLETNAELEYQQSLKEARDASLDQIKSLWENLGDVGMVKGWEDIYDNTKAYAQTEAGGGLSEEDASSLATGNVIVAVILEFAKHVKAVNEIFGIITTMFEELGPIVNDFLQPFIPVIKITVSNLNAVVPILTLLFPIIKAVATAFTWIATVVNFSAKVFQYAMGKITFWTSSDDISWDEVQAVWGNGVETTKEIWAMEIDARASYVSDLTDAQKGEIDAYKKMYESGVLNLSEYLGYRNSVTGGTNTSSIQKFATGGDFITTGPKQILVGEAGAEHVVIEPISSRNSYQSLKSGGTMIGGSRTFSPTFNIVSNDPKETARMVEDTLAKMERKGERYAS
ncbi:MAG: hypothetical protein WCR02_09545, partial [Sphaerochaetaceae bacterium]